MMDADHDGKPAGTAGAADTNECTPSTTWEWRKVRITRRPEGQKRSTAEGRSPLPSKPLARGQTVTVTLKYVGGGEAWIELRARGRRLLRPGHRYLVDVLEELLR